MNGVIIVLVTVAFALIYQVRKHLIETIQEMQREIDGLKRQVSGPDRAAPPATES
jgi:hypothetical protein